MKDHVRLLSSMELRDIRHREDREGSPYSDRDMLLDHIDLIEQSERRLALTKTRYLLDQQVEAALSYSRSGTNGNLILGPSSTQAIEALARAVAALSVP